MTFLYTIFCQLKEIIESKLSKIEELCILKPNNGELEIISERADSSNYSQSGINQSESLLKLH